MSGFHESLAQITDDDPTVTKINISRVHVFPRNAEGWRQLGVGLGRNTHVTRLNLSWNRDGVPVDYLEAFFRELVYNQSIESLIFPVHILSMGTMPVWMALLLYRSKTIETLLFDVSSQEDKDCINLATIFPYCKSVTGVILDGHVSEAAAILLAEEVRKMPNLRALRWNGSVFGRIESESLATLLKDTQTRLKVLQLRFQVFRDSAISSFSTALERNFSVEKLSFIEGRISELGWKAIATTLCLFNDHVEEIEAATVPSEVQSLLKSNESTDKVSLRMRKWLDYNFLAKDQASIGELLGYDFDIKLLPYMLSSVGNTRNDQDRRSNNYKLSALYHFTKNVPDTVVSFRCQSMQNKPGTLLQIKQLVATSFTPIVFLNILVVALSFGMLSFYVGRI